MNGSQKQWCIYQTIRNKKYSIIKEMVEDINSSPDSRNTERAKLFEDSDKEI